MWKEKPMSTRIPAAQYLRMSTEDQQYSIANQSLRIREYADKHGFQIVQTYEDPGKSGVMIKQRPGLNALLKEVLNHTAIFKAILVYDVSRWGRFQNPDEAAHYEFVCARSGIPLHYCAEPFTNDGTASSAILKALKRSMAAEFSRELGDKVYQGKTRLAQMGFWMGGPPGYGYRRAMLSPNGKIKRILKNGEQKSVKTERVTLVLGPRKETQVIRLIFALSAEGMNCTDIVRELDARRISFRGRPWNDVTILNILTNPKYAGSNVWHRYTQRLHATRKQVDPRLWKTMPRAYPAIVDQKMFDRAQTTIKRMRDSRWPDEKILKRLRRLIKVKGTLSEGVILKARNMPSTATIHKHFGTYRRVYEKLGFELDPRFVFRSEQFQRSRKLRRTLEHELQTLFPEHIKVVNGRRCRRSILRIDDTFSVSLLLCRYEKNEKGWSWEVKPTPMEFDNITLLCLLSRFHDHVVDYRVATRLGPWKYRRVYPNSPLLKQTTKLKLLSEFYAAVAKIWNERMTDADNQMSSPTPR
jgi:DNA invertase Pin-like site-specific DNA recombinase